MADLERMTESARRAMVDVLELKPDDRVLVVQDPLCWKCSQAFFDAARAEGCATTSYLLPEHGRPLKKMPDGMADAIEGQDVVINVMSGSSDEVPFRIEWLTLLEERRLRVGHSPNIHEDEKASRTAHVAFGSNIGMPGGVNESTTHIDYLIHRPTIVARYDDAAERTIVNDGELCVGPVGS